MIKKGDIIEGKVERVDFPNKGVLTVDEEQLTVKNVIPGQYIRAVVNKRRKGKREARLLEDLEACPEVDYTMGLTNIEAMDGYCLTDKLTPRQFSELIDLDYEVAELIYAAYAVNDEDYAKVVNGLPEYKVSLIDMFMFVYDEVDEGYVTLDDELRDTLDDAYRQMNFA